MMIIRLNTNEIHTCRLRLRPFRIEDFDAYAAIMADPEIGKWFPKGEGYSRDEAEKSFNRILEHWTRHSFGLWAVFQKRKPSLMGRCGLNRIDETSEVEIDFLLAKQFWGKGYATEAAQAVLEYGFTILHLSRIIALAKIENIASRKVMEKIGMRYRKNARYWGILCAYYDITKADYAPEQKRK
ncbi:MAG: GNAT family N-acetyltransferase [Candidatus Bathyarchaeota archaeon]|nr:MAG: GNAT family N-acetyltransferase [Candidatus Bathyarchaeota archaeon]